MTSVIFTRLRNGARTLSQTNTVGVVLGVVRCRSEYGDPDGAVRVGDVNEQRLVVVVRRRRVGRHNERETEFDRARHADVVVEQRLSGVQRVFDDDAKRSCAVNISLRLTTIS